MARNTTYALRLAGAFVLYAAFLVASVWFLANSDGLSQPVQVIVALLPIIPGLLIAWVMLRQINAMDEFLRKVQLDGLAIAAAGTALITFSYGFLETVGFPKLSMFFVWPLIALIWGSYCGIRAGLHVRDAGRA